MSNEKIEADLKALREADPYAGLPEEERQRLCEERTKKLQEEWMKAHIQRLVQ
jgi:hypothetical protein